MMLKTAPIQTIIFNVFVPSFFIIANSYQMFIACFVSYSVLYFFT